MLRSKNRLLRFKNRLLRFIVPALFLGGAAPVLAQDATPHITIVGTASRDVEPDRASVNVGVTTERASAADAASENARAARAVVDAIAASGIEARDIRTSALTLSPVFTQASASAPSTIRSYRATNQVTVLVRRLDATGALLQKLIEKGITNLSGPSFDVSNAEAIVDDLRGDAAKDARHKAEILASALGVKLGRVLDVSVGDAPGYRAMRAAPMAMKAGVAPPVESGTQRLSADVTVTFEIAP